MNRRQELEEINKVSNRQQRLHLLVANQFFDAATKLIKDAAESGMVFFYYDWHNPQRVCQPLKRWSKGDAVCGIFVVIHDNTKLEKSREKDDSEIVFEFGWEREVLNWSSNDSFELAYKAFLLAQVRPLNHWTLRQAEGTGRIVRRMLEASDPVRRELEAMHLVFHVRRAEFGKITPYLSDIAEFDRERIVTKLGTDYCLLIEWISSQLQFLGWSKSRIRKEFLEWIYLQKGTWAGYMEAIALSDVFDDHDPALSVALQVWLQDKMRDIVMHVLDRRDADEFRAYNALFKIADLFGSVGVLKKALITQMVAGHATNAGKVVTEFGVAMGITGISAESQAATWEKLCTCAVHSAMQDGKYRIACEIVERWNVCTGLQTELKEKMKLLQQ
ncbi:hypothetical protein H6770_03775 [Candidatus Peribacteria bacterium]|nr:hypothetical protein [Candidatus Peribacteria bacterium]